MRRVAALVLAAAVLPACESRTRRDNVDIVVRNQGATETVRVQLEVRREGRSDVDREFFVAAGDSSSSRYDEVTRVALRIYRVSDGFKLFDDFWDADDLRRENDTVDVTVSP